MKYNNIDDVRAALLSVPEDHEFEPEDLAAMFRAVFNREPDEADEEVGLYSLILSTGLLDPVSPDVAETFRAWCAEAERTEAEVRQELYEIATSVQMLTAAQREELMGIWRATEVSA